MTPPRRWISLDIETLEDRASVTCAAFAWEQDGEPRSRVFAAEGKVMTPGEAGAVLDGCLKAAAGGWRVFTWNGLSFDLQVLARAAGRVREGALFALSDNHVDGMLAFHCEHGYSIGLDAVCRGMNLKSKLDGLKGTDAIKLWEAGERNKVLAYVANDAAIQLKVAVEVERRRGITWITKKGAARSKAVDHWFAVPEALSLPVPDTSWMDEPRPRSEYAGWAEEALAGS